MLRKTKYSFIPKTTSVEESQITIKELEVIFWDLKLVGTVGIEKLEKEKESRSLSGERLPTAFWAITLTTLMFSFKSSIKKLLFTLLPIYFSFK